MNPSFTWDYPQFNFSKEQRFFGFPDVNYNACLQGFWWLKVLRLLSPSFSILTQENHLFIMIIQYPDTRVVHPPLPVKNPTLV